MNEDERISKNILKFMFCGCLVLLVALATIIIFYSPKTISPVFSENSEEPVFDELKSVFWDYWEEAEVLTKDKLEKFKKIINVVFFLK